MELTIYLHFAYTCACHLSVPYNKAMSMPTPLDFPFLAMSVRDTGSPFSTLGHPLPSRIRGPLVVETILEIDNSVSRSRRIVYPRDPSLNLVPDPRSSTI